ncbi:MAG: hypothetical protein HQM08_11065 [Candidatus Riflebacteria bacterium]|nr:hypothetical protein [Candidatus Riflebacteria bacterium]
MNSNMRTKKSGGIGVYGFSILLILVFFAALAFPYFLKMKSGIYKISCKEIRRKIETAVTNYHFNNTHSIAQPGKRVDLDMLMARGYLMEIQYCPEGGKYFFGPKGEILCSQHYPKPEPEDSAGKNTSINVPKGKEND